MNVTVYSTTTCPYCNMLKKYLEENNVEYQEKLVDQDEEARKKMLEESGGFLGVPFTTIQKNGEIHTVLGFDKGELNEILGVGSK